MKPFIIISIATISSLVLSMIVTTVITRKRVRSGTMSKKTRVLIFIAAMLVIFIGGAFIYFNTYARAGERAMKAMEGSDIVAVKDDDTGYFFDGPGTEDALVFYPGAMVDEKAYAELMLRLAGEGVDCYLVSMPLHLAVLGKDKADNIIDRGGYEHYYISGHSLGGAMACSYAAVHADKLSGALILAAYPVDKIPDSLPVVSLVGSNDTVIDKNAEVKNKIYWPSDVKEIVIEGGNHCQFGDYGFQRGDTEATITPDEQTDLTVQACMEMIRRG